MKQLSIVIVNYNTEKFLSACLNSLGAIPDTWEIIIVDNCSKEKLIIQRSKDPKIQIIENRENMGFAKANNQALRQAQGKYILLLNPDTEVSITAIQTVLDFMEKEKKAGIATCRVNLTDGTFDDACHRGFPTPWRAFCYFSGLSSLFPHSMLFNGYHLGYQHLDKVHEIESCVGAFMMIRQVAGEQIKWLDEDYFWYGEDIDFCYRAKQAGWSVWFIPHVSILHYKGVSSGIKKHSKEISTADSETTKRAQDARFEVMRIFYEKHYKNKYPPFMFTVVNSGIAVKKKISP